MKKCGFGPACKFMKAIGLHEKCVDDRKPVKSAAKKTAKKSASVKKAKKSTRKRR